MFLFDLCRRRQPVNALFHHHIHDDEIRDLAVLTPFQRIFGERHRRDDLKFLRRLDEQLHKSAGDQLIIHNNNLIRCAHIRITCRSFIAFSSFR